jgi:hypothetical protein
MSGHLVEILTAIDPAVRNRALDTFCSAATLADLQHECVELEAFRHSSRNLYERVRALFFLYAIHRFHVPAKLQHPTTGLIPYEGYAHLLQRRFEEAIAAFLAAERGMGSSAAISSALAEAYRRLALQTLADQVRRSVRSVRGNQWMFRVGHPMDHPLRVRRELLERSANGLFPILHEATPVRMEFNHSAWSDIFFLGMDYPEGARVLNVSIDLAVRGRDASPKPPVEAYFRVIDEPVLRLASVDLGASAEITSLAGVFDYAADYLGLLKAAIIASGFVPPGIEGSGERLEELLARVVGAGKGIELVSHVNGIPKGSRLAVSTSLLASLITVCMRATGQTASLAGALEESERDTVAARAILGEWLAGSGGGWQDSGGVWPDIKLITAVPAREGDPEYGISRGCLLPAHHILTTDEVSAQTRRRLQDSLVLVHGGLAQNVGPMLEMVTEKYLLRSEAEWAARLEACATLDEIIELLRAGDIRSIGAANTRFFFGPIRTIVPRASNLFTESLIEQARAEFGDDFWGFWMLGGASGGGMGFLFAPEKRDAAQDRLQEIMLQTKHRLEHALPFAIEPVVYDFAINTRGTFAELLADGAALMPPAYYTLTIPALLRQDPLGLSAGRRHELNRFGAVCRTQPAFSGTIERIFDRIVPGSAQEESEGRSLADLLAVLGFDRVQHEQIRADLRTGRIGLAQNRLPARTVIRDVDPGDVTSVADLPNRRELHAHGLRLLGEGTAAVVTFAAGVGSRWTEGAGVVKALNPFCRLAGKHRSFLEIHLAKSRRTSRECGTDLTHVVTTSFLTDQATRDFLAAHENYGYAGPLVLSPGQSVGLRLVPMARDLRFAWEEMPQQLLDEQAQKVRDSLRAALIGWAQQVGEGSDYTDNVPLQCLHPVGHWFEFANMLRNGVLARLMAHHPALQVLMVHNIDTVGTDLDPALLRWHLESQAAMTVEVIRRHVDDRGGGLARADGRLRLIEGLAMPREQDEFTLTFYNTGTMWLHIDRVLAAFGLTRADLGDDERVTAAVRTLAARMPTYITLKDVKKRWGQGQEDILPVAQFEKLWGDMTALPELACRYVEVPRPRGQQLKEIAQIDGWLRDGSSDYVAALCEF